MSVCRDIWKIVGYRIAYSGGARLDNAFGAALVVASVKRHFVWVDLKNCGWRLVLTWVGNVSKTERCLDYCILRSYCWAQATS